MSAGSPLIEPYSFERDAEMTYEDAKREIEAWHEETPEPSGVQIAERLFWRYARLWADDLDAFGDHIWRVWVEEAITAEQAARLAMPLAEEVFGADRAGFGEWVERWFIERGVSREVCVEALGLSAPECGDEVSHSVATPLFEVIRERTSEKQRRRESMGL